MHAQVLVLASGRLPHFWEGRYHPGFSTTGREGADSQRESRCPDLPSCFTCPYMHTNNSSPNPERRGRSILPSHIFRPLEFLHFPLGSHLWKVVLSASPLLMETYPFLLFVQLREGEREIQEMYELGTFENYVSASERLDTRTMPLLIQVRPKAASGPLPDS